MHTEIQKQRLKKRAKSILGQLIFAFRLHHLLLSNAAVVVAFHRVNNTLTEDPLTCSVEMFEMFCRFFSKHFHVVSLQHLVKNLEDGSPLNRDLAITFDDGYRDNYEYAAPVLTSMELPATFFVVTDFIDTEFVPWWDRSLDPRQPWMTWDEVRSLYRQGFDIGGHTRTHPGLAQVFGDEAREEILGCRIKLERKLSAPVDLFAYPFGKQSQISESNREIVRAAGFRSCCSCFGGVNFTGTDPFNLHRIPISPWFESPYHFGCEVALRRV